MKTRATLYLTRKKIPFEIIEYEHLEKGAEFASRKTGFPLSQTIKTLVADLGPFGHVLALLPGDKHLNMKKLARACCAKRAALADTETAQRLTGYWVGGISPFGTKQSLPVVMESRVANYDRVVINAGQRGIMLAMNPKDILAATGGKLAELAD